MYEIRVHPPAAGRRVVSVAGELDMSVAGQLCEAVRQACGAEQVRWVILDLERVTLIDSSGVKELVDAQYPAAARNQLLIVRNASGIVTRVLQVTGAAGALGLGAAGYGGTVYGSRAKGPGEHR